MSRRKRPTPPRVWQPMFQTALANAAETTAMLARIGMKPPDEMWGNDTYTCTVRYVGTSLIRRDGLVQLSIHRHDRKAIRDWRHFQAIKNDVIGRERCAVEVYPPESMLVDTSNEFHLWVLPADAALPPWVDGYANHQQQSTVMTPDELADANAAVGMSGSKARQRPWQRGLTTGPGEETIDTDNDDA